MKAIEALVAYVYFGSAKLTAAYLGISRTAFYGRLERLRNRYRARTTAHLAVRLYPWLHEYYAIRHRRYS